MIMIVLSPRSLRFIHRTLEIKKKAIGFDYGKLIVFFTLLDLDTVALCLSLLSVIKGIFYL